MKLRDILPKNPIKIMLRCNPPAGFDKPDGILSGYCFWNGAELLPLDGDYYTVEAEISRYEFANDYLVVWETVDWM